MSAVERERLVVVRQAIEGRLRQAVAAERLGLSVRQVKRLVRAYRSMGAKGLVSLQRGRVSPRRLSAAKRAEIAGLLSGKYQGFGPTLAAEKLGELEAIQVSRETVRGLQIAHGLWRAKRRREARVFSPRQRRAHVLAHGLPLALYSGRHGIFRVNAKDAASGDGKTEFWRVAERLGIELIHARTRAEPRAGWSGPIKPCRTGW